MASALRRVDATVRDKVELVFITTDPERDTPAVVRGYLDRFDPAYVGLTASIETVKAAAASLNIAYAGKDAATGGGYEVVPRHPGDGVPRRHRPGRVDAPRPR